MVAIPRAGELNPNIVAKALHLTCIRRIRYFRYPKGRPPLLCDGCSHWDSSMHLMKPLNLIRQEGYFLILVVIP